jgi:AcrR family transcriptional regulator
MPSSSGTTATEPGRRERKRLEVRDRLYVSAVDLFVSQGFEATTMDQIAEHADVARATVFNYFPQKVSFLEEWGKRRRAKVDQILTAALARDLPAAEQLRGYLREIARLNVESRRETMTLMEASLRFGGLLRTPALDTELTEVIRRGQHTGDLWPDMAAEQAGTLLAAGYFSAVLRWINTEPAPFDLTDYLDTMLDLALHGLTAATPSSDTR